MLRERAGNFLPEAFLFFFGIHFSNSGERAEARAYAVFASELLLRDDPVAHLRPLLPEPYRAGRQQRYRLILTRISASFGAVTRELSQNGNWFRVMSVMESFERPPRSVPSDALTIPCTSSGKRCRGNCVEILTPVRQQESVSLER